MASHMNSQTYHSVTELTSSKATAAVCRPNFPSFSSFIHDLGSQLSGLSKTISHSPIIAFSSSDSSPIPMVAVENPSRFNSSTWSLMIEIEGETTIIADISSQDCNAFNTSNNTRI